jgi:hypothetical protein
VLLGAGAFTTAVISACSTDPALIGPGGACFLATDCAPGLVCVPQRGGGSVCSDDLSSVTGDPPDMGGDMDAAGDADGANQGDGTTDGVAPPPPPPPPPTDGGADTNPPDTGADTGPADAGAE